jgi:hypothetical protein
MCAGCGKPPQFYGLPGSSDSRRKVANAASTAATVSNQTGARRAQHRAAARGAPSNKAWAAKTKPHR